MQSMGDGFQVGWVDTQFITTGVMDFQAKRNQSIPMQERGSMRPHLATVNTGYAISVIGLPSQPQPTFGGFVGSS
jgi:hypothetical protein